MEVATDTVPTDPDTGEFTLLGEAWGAGREYDTITGHGTRVHVCSFRGWPAVATRHWDLRDAAGPGVPAGRWYWARTLDVALALAAKRTERKFGPALRNVADAVQGTPELTAMVMTVYQLGGAEAVADVLARDAATKAQWRKARKWSQPDVPRGPRHTG